MTVRIVGSTDRWIVKAARSSQRLQSWPCTVASELEGNIFVGSNLESGLSGQGWSHVVFYEWKLRAIRARRARCRRDTVRLKGLRLKNKGAGKRCRSVTKMADTAGSVIDGLQIGRASNTSS